MAMRVELSFSLSNIQVIHTNSFSMYADRFDNEGNVTASETEQFHLFIH